MSRISGLTLSLAVLSMAFFLLLVFLRIPFPPEPLMSYQDALDLATPVVLLPLYWLIFRRSASEPQQRGEGLVFVALAAIWAMGHGMHLAANSIGNLLGARASQLSSEAEIAALTHLYDEVLSHYLWHAGVIGLAILLIYREWRRPAGESTAWAMTAIGGVIYGVTLFSIFIEGQTVVIGLPFTAATAIFSVVWGRRLLSARPVLAFFATSTITALLLLVGWWLYWGGFPQFSEIGLI